MDGLVTAGDRPLARVVADAIASLAADPAIDADTAARDARILVADALGLDRLALIVNPDHPVSPTDQQRVADHLASRVAGAPVSRILGWREFWGLAFRLGPDTLDPRPDSETVVQAALDATADRPQAPLDIVDLGVGTGCLVLSLLSERPHARGLGVDCTPGAIQVARVNARALHLDARMGFLVANWCTALAGNIADIIVANPPYIAQGALDNLDRVVRDHDPRTALDGGFDGLDAYRAIAADLPRVMRVDGTAVLEIGHGQRHAVCEIVNCAGLAVTDVYQDLSGRDRVIVAHNRKKTW